MSHLEALHQIACNHKLSLTIRYEIARYLQEQRKQQRNKEKNQRDHVRRQLKQLRKHA